MVSVSRFISFQGYAVSPEDVQFREAASQEVLLNHNGVLVPAKVIRWAVTLTLRGITQSQANAFVREARNNNQAMTRGAIAGEDLNFGVRTIRQAVLTSAQATPPITVGTTPLVEALQLDYQSLVFE